MRALRIDWSEPGAPLSAAAHAALLVAILVGFAGSPKLQDTQESIPVETITDAQFNQIMKGEKTAKPSPQPQLKVDKVAPVALRKPTPPTPAAKIDTPTRPPRLRPAEDPGEDEKLDAAKPPPAKAPPTKTSPTKAAVPPPVPVPKPVPKPAPQHSEPKPQPATRHSASEAKKLPTPDKPDAEVIERAKPPKATKEPTKEAAKAPAPTPVPKPRPTVHKPVAEAKPEPKAKPDGKPLKDRVAKLLEEKKLEEIAAEPSPKPVDKPKKHHAKPKSSHATDDALMGDIKQLLSKEPPQSTGSTGHKLSHVASLGAPNANAPRLSPFMMGTLAELIKREYYRCWVNAGLEDGGYIPEFKIRYKRDWSLAATPVLRNKPANAKQSAIARSALQAIMDQRCNPLPIPPSYARYYDDWKELPIGFNPSDAPSG